MNSFKEILIQLGPEQQVGNSLGVSRESVASWKRRGSIPPQYWRKVRELAEQQGLVIEYEDLASLAEQKQKEGAQ